MSIQKITLLILFYMCICACQGQQTISTSDWRADLRYLQKRIHSDYSPLFHKISVASFDQAVDQLDKQIPHMQQHEIIVGFARLIAMFQYGHTGISLVHNMHGAPPKTGFHIIPVNFYYFSDGVFIQGISREYENAVGGKVIRIGNKSIEEALQAIRPVVSIENEQFFKGYGISMLSCPEVLHALGVTDKMDQVPILIEVEGKQIQITLKAENADHMHAPYGLIHGSDYWAISRNLIETPLWLKELHRPYYFEYLSDSKTVYVRQSQIRDDPNKSISSFYEEVFDFVAKNEVNRFVLDLRLNGGGNNYLNKPIILGLIKSKINQKGKLFTIIGRRTFSAAQNLVNELEKYTETTFVGEPTAENINFFGDVRIEPLPHSQLDVRLSYMWWQDNDPRDMRPWTTPEIAVEVSSETYANNQDPVLATILSYSSSVPQTLGQIRAQIAQSAYEKAEKTAFEFLQDPANKYLNINAELNSFGYELMNKKKLKAAIATFEINTKLYPESANAWDSLAEGYLNAHDFKNAILYYEKVVKMDPDGRTGAHAQEMLDKIKAHMNK